MKPENETTLRPRRAALSLRADSTRPTYHLTHHEFTIDFARVDHSVEPEQGVVVARVGISARMLQQLTDTLGETWADYAERVYDGVLPDDQ